MAVVEMHKVIICAMKENRKNILELLQRKGCMEVHEEFAVSKKSNKSSEAHKESANSKTDADSEIAESSGRTDTADSETVESLGGINTANPKAEGLFGRMNTATQISIFEKNMAMSEHALEILGRYFPEDAGMLSSLDGTSMVESDEYYEIVENQQQLMGYVSDIIAKDKQIDEYNANIAKLREEIEILKPWENLDVAMNYSGSKTTMHTIGGISGSFSNEELLIRMEEMNAPKDLSIKVVSNDKYQTYISCIYMKENTDKAEAFLRELGFTKPPVVAHHVPKQSMENRFIRIKKAQEQIEQLKEELKVSAEYRYDIKKLADYYRSRSVKYKVLGSLLQSKHTFIITGYMPKIDAEALQNEIEENYTAVFRHEKADGDAPVLLKNSAFTNPVESVVKSFALPTKKEIDPTAFTAVFYYFLFGIMLSDAAYGLIMFLACFILLKKHPSMGDGMKKTFQMFMYCGISTLIWGILFGGYFGNAISVISSTFFGKEVTIPPLWFEPVTQPMKMLIYCMIFGIVHLFTGLAIKGYLMLKERDITAFVFDVLMWYFLLIGLILMLIPTSIFSAFIEGTVAFPAWLNILAKILAITGCIGILFMAGRRARNPAKRLMLGAYSLYDITSWLSDLLSYSRLLALGLATGVIAQVINTMAAMGGKSVVGVILFVVVFLFGHTFNMAINLLGAYVHTNRLQFVEFFGKFYEGGGREFTPFVTDTKYTDFNDVKEKAS